MKKYVKPARQVTRIEWSVEAPYVLLPYTPADSPPPRGQRDIEFFVSCFLYSFAIYAYHLNATQCNLAWFWTLQTWCCIYFSVSFLLSFFFFTHLFHCYKVFHCINTSWFSLSPLIDIWVFLVCVYSWIVVLREDSWRRVSPWLWFTTWSECGSKETWGFPKAQERKQLSGNQFTNHQFLFIHFPLTNAF